MSWWYFHIIDNKVVLANPDDFKSRPKDANPSNGNPYTPWYQTEEHQDVTHIHIKANDYESAFKKAKLLMCNN